MFAAPRRRGSLQSSRSDRRHHPRKTPHEALVRFARTPPHPTHFGNRARHGGDRGQLPGPRRADCRPQPRLRCHREGGWQRQLHPVRGQSRCLAPLDADRKRRPRANLESRGRRSHHPGRPDLRLRRERPDRQQRGPRLLPLFGRTNHLRPGSAPMGRSELLLGHHPVVERHRSHHRGSFRPHQDLPPRREGRQADRVSGCDQQQPGRCQRGPPAGVGDLAWLRRATRGGGANVAGATFAGSVSGGTLVAQDSNSLVVPVDGFSQSSVTYFPNPADAGLAGQFLQLRLCALDNAAATSK